MNTLAISVGSKNIAVIVPVYNIAPYIGECLESLLAQTYTHWVAYVIDDGSTDESGRIVDEYAAKDSRFRVFHKQNGGLGNARNFALDRIESEQQVFAAVTFLDGDDWISPNAYSELLPKMLSEQPDILFFGEKRAFPDGRVIERKYAYPEGTIDRMSYVRAVISYKDWDGKNGSWGFVWNKFFHPEVIAGIRFTEDRTSVEDEPFCLQAGLRSTRFYFINKPYYFYRWRENSLVRADDFEAKVIRARMLVLDTIVSDATEENLAIQEYIKAVMLRASLKAKRRELRQFFRDGSFFSKVAEEVLPIAEEQYKTGLLNESDYHLVKIMASASGLADSEKVQSEDFLAQLTSRAELAVQLMLDEIRTEKNLNRKLLQESRTEKDFRKRLTQQISDRDKKIISLQKGVSDKDKKIMSLQKLLKSFSIGKYLKYKVLSKLTFGSMRSRHRKKYQEQKKLYRAIKRGSL